MCTLHGQIKHSILFKMATSSINDSTEISLSSIRESSITWTTETVDFDYFANQVRIGTVDLEPEHQRDVVHDDEWQIQIIISALITGDIPELYFDKVPHEIHGEKKRSLDGKQRGTSIARFMSGELGFPKKNKIPVDSLKCLAGKKLKDLSPKNQAVLRGLKVNYKVANRTLTDEEVMDFFSKRQETKKTKQGEFLNSCIGSNARKFIVNDLFRRESISKYMDDYKQKMEGTLKRHGNLDLAAQCLYHFVYPDMKSMSNDKIKRWWKSCEVIPDTIRETFVITFHSSIKFILEKDIKNPGKAVLLPIFAYIRKFGIDSAINTYFTRHRSFDDVVGGNHSAWRERLHHLQAFRESI